MQSFQIIVFILDSRTNVWYYQITTKEADFVMGTKFDTYCGLSCEGFEFKESMNCGGCIATEGNPFHGKCKVAECAKSKNRRFCGECGDFPCDLLKKYSYDAEHGDNGARIENCKRIKTELVAEARVSLNPLGVCGFSCDHCFMGEWCGGCRSNYNCCSYGTLFEGNICPNVSCAAQKGLEGCYQCDELDGCKKGYYSIETEHDAKASALFIREYGPEKSRQALKNIIKKATNGEDTLKKAESVEAAFAILKENL